MTRLLLFLAIAATACRDLDPEPGCRTGFTLAPDGHCYPPLDTPTTPSVTDVLLANECVRAEPGTDIDLFAGCIEGVCAGDTFLAMEEALGGGARCSLVLAATNWICEWPQGVEAQFRAGTTDSGEPGDNVTNNFVRALTEYEGSDPSGLALGLSVSCFVEELGIPTEIVYRDTPGRLVPLQLVWDAYGIEIEDEEQLIDGVAIQDDHVDEITLFGP